MTADSFQFLENFQDMASVSDAETHEILYRNRAMLDYLRSHSPNDCNKEKFYDFPDAERYPGMPVHEFDPNQECQNFLTKHTVYSEGGKTYLIKFFQPLAFPEDTSRFKAFSGSGDILQACLNCCIGETDPDAATDKILKFLGQTLECDRTCIFEIREKNMVCNTYEWCRPGISSQQNALQNIPFSEIDVFTGKNSRGQYQRVVIADTEALRTSFPVTYSLLKPQNINSLVADAFYLDHQIAGFFALENIRPDSIRLAAPITGVIGYCIAEQFKRRDVYRHLQEMSFRDYLTGAFNRNAMFDGHHYDQLQESLGLIYGDISGLKLINETMGHTAGDTVILSTYQFLSSVLDTKRIYRVGGDEFIAAYAGKSQNFFNSQAELLREKISHSEVHISISTVWTDHLPINLEELLLELDRRMYESKQAYYRETWSGTASDRCPAALCAGSPAAGISPLDKFSKTTYTDVTSFFHSISSQNESSYFFLGDVQKNLFYVSDNMRDDFGFCSNIVTGLPQIWEAKIPNPTQKKQYHNALSLLMKDRDAVLDLRHQVLLNTAAQEKKMWVHAHAQLQWDEDGKTPLFYSGRVTHQDDGFLIDPLTNFPSESVALHHLSDITPENGPRTVVGFSLNRIAEINSTRGRAYGEKLIRHLTATLETRFAGILSFYRLDGMRFMALADPAQTIDKLALVSGIKSTITDEYHLHGITIKNPCSFAVIDYTPQKSTPSELLSNLVPLIKVAQQDSSQPYLDDSTINFQKIRQMSDIFLSLGRDVMNGMENFRVVVQPIVSTKTGKIIAGETLSRWRFRGDDVSPAMFIPRLEKDQMISIAGKRVFEQAVGISRRLSAMNPDFYLTVNVSLQQLSDPTFPDFVRDTLMRYHLNGKHIVVELTESCMDEEPDKLVSFVELCSSCGIRVALDDFGSGYSSLRVLLQYPSSIIKLDRSLLIEIMDSERKLQFIRSMVYACHQFGKKVCMEGVETPEQDMLAKKCGCDMIQGFYYHRPMETDDIYSLFSSSCGEVR